jgi:hypothetical protein
MAKPTDITPAGIKTLLGKALTDEAFRKKLLESPEKVLDEHGHHLSPKTVEFFKSLKQGGFDAATQKLKAKGENDPIERAGDM